MKRFLKQIIFGSIFLIIVGGAVFLLGKYFFPGEQPDPNPPVVVNAEQIKVLWTKIIELKNSQFNVVAQIENPNKNLGSKSFAYEFIFYDENNQEIKREKGKSYIMPDEKKYIISMFSSIEKRPAYVNFQISDAQWQNAALETIFSIREKNYGPSDFKVTRTYYEATGIVDNSSGYDFRDVEISVVLFDASGGVIDVNKTGVNNLLSKESRFFKAGWYYELPSNVSKLEVKADTNIFDLDNLIIRQGGKTDLLIE